MKKFEKYFAKNRYYMEEYENNTTIFMYSFPQNGLCAIVLEIEENKYRVSILVANYEKMAFVSADKVSWNSNVTFARRSIEGITSIVSKDVDIITNEIGVAHVLLDLLIEYDATDFLYDNLNEEVSNKLVS